MFTRSLVNCHFLSCPLDQVSAHAAGSPLIHYPHNYNMPADEMGPNMTLEIRSAYLTIENGLKKNPSPSGR